jgi:hypothetical protein
MVLRMDKRVVERGFNSFIKHFIAHNFGPKFHDYISLLYSEVAKGKGGVIAGLAAKADRRLLKADVETFAQINMR